MKKWLKLSFVLLMFTIAGLVLRIRTLNIRVESYLADTARLGSQNSLYLEMVISSLAISNKDLSVIKNITVTGSDGNMVKLNSIINQLSLIVNLDDRFDTSVYESQIEKLKILSKKTGPGKIIWLVSNKFREEFARRSASDHLEFPIYYFTSSNFSTIRDIVNSDFMYFLIDKKMDANGFFTPRKGLMDLTDAFFSFAESKIVTAVVSPFD